MYHDMIMLGLKGTEIRESNIRKRKRRYSRDKGLLDGISD
jgi:hypothetical protein